MKSKSHQLCLEIKLVATLTQIGGPVTCNKMWLKKLNVTVEFGWCLVGFYNGVKSAEPQRAAVAQKESQMTPDLVHPQTATSCFETEAVDLKSCT